MTLKIFANLNLNQSLSDFQVNIPEILKLNNVTEWSGKTIKEREEKIREAALILAGQCVAILLDNLSKSKEAQEKALNLTRGWWRKKTKKNGYKTWQILTVGNVIVKLKLPYVVEIKKRKDYKIKPKGQGFCPFLRWLGMEEGISPYVYSTLAKYGTITTSFEMSRQTLMDWGLKDKRVIISVDGGRTRVRIDKNEKPNPKTKRKKYTGEWIEPKLLTIYTVDERGKKIKNSEVPLINDGTYDDYKKFLKILEIYLVSLGITQAKQILLIADGADWIWLHIPP
jgi:hypothetical protein